MRFAGMILMGERPSEYARDVNDWYVEPKWCIDALTDRVSFIGMIHDPCCGIGTIPMVVNGTGADLIDRGFGYPVRDFLKDDRDYDNIVTNPPYGIAQDIIEHALNHSRHQVAALVQTKFLSSQRRHKLFSRPETKLVVVFSRRPSMPPGEMLVRHGEGVRGNGSIDFCWVVWDRAHKGECAITWAV